MNLREFVQTEMQKRQMSAREFARFVGVSHGTINNIVNYSSDHVPSLEFLRSLSNATNVSLCDLVAMVYPDSVSVSPYAQVLAQYIEMLPPDSREIIDNYIRGKAIEIAQQQDKPD